MKPGALNLITDVPGLRVGHATDETVRSGVTVLVCDRACPAAADVRGGAPGGRETDVLNLENQVGHIHAIVLTGGSVFGLSAAEGVTVALSRQGVGLAVREGAPRVPIVPAAVLFDLANGGDKDWGGEPPYRRLGEEALAAAGAEFMLGSVGAGRGAQAGAAKGGVGSASLDLGDGVVVGALVAANPVGSVLMPDGRTFWAWPFEIGDEFGGHRPAPDAGAAIDPMPDLSRLGRLQRLNPGANTTIAIVACSAGLTRAECKRMAIMAHDGMARAVRPAHTPFDGDTVFALATGAASLADDSMRPRQVARIGSAAADCLARAIARAVHAARPA